jgi:hypothetical protein
MNFNNTLFRASSIGKLMTEPRSKSERLSETAKSYLRQLYKEIKYGRKYEFTSKYVDKGLQVEEDSITLYSRVKKIYFKKNEERLKNDHLCGTPDLFIGVEITRADTILDIKSSWNLFTFPFPGDPINKDYYWQLQTYMALTGASFAKLVYCLVDTPETLIQDEERKLFYKMNAGTFENPDYIKACEELRKSMIFQDIPMHDRVVEYDVERNDTDILRIIEKAKVCREYLNELEATMNPSIILAHYEPNDKITIVQ